MLFTRLKFKNWRNFREADISLSNRTFLIGANASGKSNLMEIFRFLRTLAQPQGGGLQQAVQNCGGLSKLRSLHAKKDTEVRIEVEVLESKGETDSVWRYVIAFKGEGKGQNRIFLTEERVEHRGRTLLLRPNDADRSDKDRLTQTHLEQINNNIEFRRLVEYFASTTYLHLVPQLLKHPEISGRTPESDPFGQGLLQQLARTSKKTRDARLRRINDTLQKAVPLFSELRFEQDAVTGQWHLEANFRHWRAQGAWQREDQFSDGTLRLIGLLWALQEGDGLLLLEEPELSLNDGIVAHIPLLIDRILRARKTERQVLVSTHSEALLEQISDASQVLLIEPGDNGSKVRGASAEETRDLEAGLKPAEVLLPKTRPGTLAQLGLF